MRFLNITLPTAAENVALDEALVVSAEEGSGGSTLRVWELDHLAVVLGASGRTLDDVNVDACRADGVPIARRSSGGGTVLIGPGALNFTVVLPIDADPRFRAVDTAQVAILERVAEAIRGTGADARVRGSGDLTLDGRKFSGSAQRRLRRTLMVHATLLYRMPAGAVSRYLRPPLRQPSYREGRSHDDFLTNLPLDRPSIVGAITTAWPCVGVGGDPPLELARRLLAEKFGRDDWTSRL